MIGLEEKSDAPGGKILVLHANLGIALSPRLAAILTLIYILPGLSHSCPAAKTYFLLLPHLQKVFHSSFSVLHTSPFAPSSAPRHTTSQLFSPGCKGLGARQLAFTPAMKCSTEHIYKTASNARKLPPLLLGISGWLQG